jgi:hypothetical protein
MVWGCITSQGVGFLTKIEGNMDKELYCSILQDELQQTIHYYDLNPPNVIFQHDNDPKHTAKMVKNWLENQPFSILDWPPQSPDLNPIEHIWQMLKIKLNSYPTMASGVHELWDRVQEQWETFTKEECFSVIKNMPERIKAVIKAKGGHTKY